MNMNCAEVQEQLSAYHDGELPSEQMAPVAKHLARCPQCEKLRADFEHLSAGIHRLESPTPPRDIWQRLQAELGEASAAQVETLSVIPPARLRRPVFRVFHPALVAAVLLLVMMAWFSFESWIAPHQHGLLAADLKRYADQFQHNPDAAQEFLLSKYDGRTLSLSDATRQVGYAPAALHGLPDTYTVDAIHLLRMPCCDCLQTVCLRPDGSQVVIFEYGEEEPVSVGQRSGGMMACCGENCCFVQVNELFAASWKKGDRHISVLGVRDEAEIEALATSLK